MAVLRLCVVEASGHKMKPGRGVVLWFFFSADLLDQQHHLAGQSLADVPPPWDQAFYLYMGLRYLHALLDYGPVTAFREFIHLSTDVAPSIHSPRCHYICCLVLRLVAYLTNIFYLGLLLGIYLLGPPLWSQCWSSGGFHRRDIHGNSELLAGLPVGVPATAFVTLAMYALLRSEAFRRRRWGLALGF
jgi:hypothetical protein